MCKRHSYFVQSLVDQYVSLRTVYNGNSSRFGVTSPSKCTDTALQFPAQGRDTGSNFLQDHIYRIRELTEFINGNSNQLMVLVNTMDFTKIESLVADRTGPC